MGKKSYKTKVSKLIEEAKQKQIVRKYSEFIETEDGKKNALSEEEITYYTSNGKGEKK